jgi:hypothetical protein
MKFALKDVLKETTHQETTPESPNLSNCANQCGTIRLPLLPA